MENYFNLHRKNLLDLLPNNIQVSNALDVGCAEGNFGKLLKEKYKCKVWGIEPDFESSKLASNNLDNVFNGTFEASIININIKFDLICFNDVLEHMVSPENTLSIAKNYINENGIIQCSVPNILHYHEFLNILINKDFKYEDKGIMDRTHLRWFTKKSLVRLFEECGYKVIKVEGLDPTKSKKMSLINLLSLGYLNEMKYPQFALQAQLK